MSSEPLDVALRVRMRYEAGDGSARVTGDLEKVRAITDRLGAGTAGSDRLNQGLRNTSVLAQSVQRDMARVAASATRLGSTEGTTRLTGGLKDAGQAAGGASREIAQLGQLTARFGAVSTVSYLTRDLKAVHAPAQALKRDLTEVREASERVGRSSGLRELEGDLQRASRRADDLDRHLAAVGRRRSNGRSGSGEHMEFANEALRASGLGVGGLRFGMGGAAAGGLAAGAGMAAIGGSMAMATRQAIDFEHAMTEVRKAVNDTPDGMRMLEQDILRFSRASGIAKTEVAGLVAQAGYLNVPRDQLQGFSEIATKAAIGFQMRPEEAGEALGHLRASYKLKDNAELRSAGDAINTIGDNVGTRERDILNYLNRTSGVAGMLRIPLAKNAAIGGAVQSLGVAPDVAATGVSEVFSRLSNANLEGKEFQRGLRGINMSGRQVKAMMDQDAVGGLLTVLERINKLSDAKKPNVIRDMFGEGEIATVSRLAESVDKIRSSLDLVSDPSRYQGSLEKTFKIFSSDTQAQIKRTEAALSSWATRIGQQFSPAVKDAAAAVERWFNAMNKAMDRRDRADILGTKIARGGTLTPAEQAEVDANPRLKRNVDEQQLYRRRADEIEAGRRRLVEPPVEGAPAPPTMEEARERFRKRAEEFERRRRGEAPGETRPEAIPGTGKRSDLQEGAKASLASYHEEVDRSLTRTERLAREMGRRIREDLEIRAKVQDVGSHVCGCADQARIERASISSGVYGYGSGFGVGGGLGGVGGGGGSRGMPGRFGGSVPMPRGGRGIEGGPAGGGRRRGGSSEPAEDGPTESIPGALNPRLAGSRKALMDELDRDPALRRDVLKTASMENRGSAFKMQTVLESMVNRAKMNGYTSLRQAIHSGFYGPVNRGGLSGALSEKDRRDGEEALKRVREGSNAIGYRTDQGMLTDPGARRYMREPDHSGHRVIGGENYFYMGRKGREWARRQEAEDARQSNPAVAGGRRPEVLADPHDERRVPDGGIRQLQPWTRRHPTEGRAGERMVSLVSGDRRRANASIDDFLDEMQKDPRSAQIEAESRQRYKDQTEGPRPDESFRDFYRRRADATTGTNEHQPARRTDDASGDNGFGSARRRTDLLNEEAQRNRTRDSSGTSYEERLERGVQSRAPAPSEFTPRRELTLDEIRRFRRPEPEARSPRFMDPASYSLKPGAGGDQNSGAAGSARFGVGGPKVEQHFHGGFDAHEVGRRAQLEQNREIRRTMAGALHDVGHPVSV